jgi:hypothetical protein
MKNGRPPQPVAIVLGQAELLSNQFAQGPDALGVSASVTVVSAQGGGQHEELLGRNGGIIPDVGHSPAEVTRGP